MRSVLPGKMPYVRPKQRFVGMVKEDVVGWCEWGGRREESLMEVNELLWWLLKATKGTKQKYNTFRNKIMVVFFVFIFLTWLNLKSNNILCCCNCRFYIYVLSRWVFKWKCADFDKAIITWHLATVTDPRRRKHYCNFLGCDCHQNRLQGPIMLYSKKHLWKNRKHVFHYTTNMYLSVSLTLTGWMC